MTFNYYSILVFISVSKSLESNPSLEHINCSQYGYSDHKTKTMVAETRQSHLPADGSLAQACKWTTFFSLVPFQFLNNLHQSGTLWINCQIIAPNGCSTVLVVIWLVLPQVVVDPADPSQQPQPPLIFTTDNRPQMPFQLGPVHIGHIGPGGMDNSMSVSGDRIIVGAPSEETSSGEGNRQPPFFVKVEGKSASAPSTLSEVELKAAKAAPQKPVAVIPVKSSTKPNAKPSIPKPSPPKPTTAKPTEPSTSTTTLPPGPEPQPLPPAAKPLADKKECVVLGRAGNCFPYFPLRNVFDCFVEGGIVAMDIVRCSWVRACCVHNFL